MANNPNQKLLAGAAPSAMDEDLRIPPPPRPLQRQKPARPRRQAEPKPAPPESNDTVQLPRSKRRPSVKGDEISCGITEFLRRTGISRSYLYTLLDRGEIESFLGGEKRFVILRSWFDFVERQQEAEKRGELFANRGGNPTRLGFRRSTPGVDKDQEREPLAGIGARRARPRRHFPPTAPGA